MANDPLADMQNLIGYAGLVGPNKYTNPAWNDIPYPFGQSAPAGPLGQLPGFAQMNTGVMGNAPPTDANGNPIKGFVDYSNDQNALYAKQMADYNAKLAAGPAPGTTINSTPGAGAAPDNSALMNYIQMQNQGIIGNPANLNQGGFGAGNGVLSNSALMQIRDNATMLDSLKAQAKQGAAGGQPGPGGSGIGPPPTPTNLSGAYLDALRNPGPLTPVGAAPPGPGQTPTGTPGPSVMQAFLAANPKGTPFVKALRGLQNG